jgi:hypothetical protein
VLSEVEQRRFEEVCMEHIWSALGAHSVSGATGSDSVARSAAISVRQLVVSAKIYRDCWERIKPMVQQQGFRSFVAIVDGPMD